MKMQFNIDEIFEIAEQIERNGAAFYAKGAQSVSNEKVRSLFCSLARMEKDHEKTFASMRQKLTEKERSEVFLDPEKEASLYLRAFADNQVFDVRKPAEQILAELHSPMEVVQKAMWFEKETVVFYVAMKQIVPESLGCADIDLIITEEIRHIGILSDMARNLSTV